MGYSTPVTLPETLRLLAAGDVTIIAGGTDYFPQIGDQKAPTNLLDISRVPELRGVSRADDGWRIGGATTWSNIIRADLPPAFDGLKLAAREVGSVQIQNAGTIAGNLCNASPAADGVPPLLTLGAMVELVSTVGTRRVALADFITGVRKVDLRDGELVAAIHIPALPEATFASFIKLGSRRYMVISIAMVSVLVSLDGAGHIELARIAVGSCSVVAQRLAALEAALAGKNRAQLSAQSGIWSEHLGGVSPIGDVRGSAAYRLEAAGELCRRAVFAAMEKANG
jgi:CO/xanthine dehydrogenase FAD-binding subunit